MTHINGKRRNEIEKEEHAMKYYVELASYIKGDKAEPDYWEFDSLREAEAKFDELDLERMWKTEHGCGNARDMVLEKSVYHLENYAEICHRLEQYGWDEYTAEWDW